MINLETEEKRFDDEETLRQLTEESAVPLSNVPPNTEMQSHPV